MAGSEGNSSCDLAVTARYLPWGRALHCIASSRPCQAQPVLECLSLWKVAECSSNCVFLMSKMEHLFNVWGPVASSLCTVCSFALLCQLKVVHLAQCVRALKNPSSVMPVTNNVSHTTIWFRSWCVLCEDSPTPGDRLSCLSLLQPVKKMEINPNPSSHELNCQKSNKFPSSQGNQRGRPRLYFHAVKFIKHFVILSHCWESLFHFWVVRKFVCIFSGACKGSWSLWNLSWIVRGSDPVSSFSMWLSSHQSNPTFSH